jgi:3-oxoacyl-[acyl-carrier protein] reductase
MVVESMAVVCTPFPIAFGRIVDRSSTSDYAASKGGLMGMMKNLSTRLAQYNISVNDVAPAMIGATGMTPNAEAVPGVVETIPLGRLGQPDEVANAVEMFAKTGYCTGQSLIVAGGLK